MERITVLVTSSPASPAARRAFRLILELTAAGHRITLGLLEDGVLAGTGRVPGVPLEKCADVLVQRDDLALRGLDEAKLPPRCRACTYEELIGQVMGHSDRTLGAF